MRRVGAFRRMRIYQRNRPRIVGFVKPHETAAWERSTAEAAKNPHGIPLLDRRMTIRHPFSINRRKSLKNRVTADFVGGTMTATAYSVANRFGPEPDQKFRFIPVSTFRMSPTPVGFP